MVDRLPIEGKSKIFVSYSRSDIEFADRLVAALEVRGFDVLIDRRNLPKLEDWQRELLAFVRQADTVIFIVSPHSITSQVCAWELDQVRIHAKRLAPVVISEVQNEKLPSEIARINHILFTDPGDFEQRVNDLAAALRTDLDWLKEHTRLAELARHWIETNKPDYALIRGRDIDDAEAWAARRPRAAPILTEEHLAFLAASRASQAALLRAEREQIANTRKFQKRATWGLASLAVVVFVGMSVAIVQSRKVDFREGEVMTSLAEKAMDNRLYDRAMRIALAGLPPRGSLSFAYWSQDAESKLAEAALLSRLVFQLRHEAWVDGASFSADGKRILTHAEDKTARIWDAESGKEILVLRGHQNAVIWAQFSPDNTRVGTSSYDATARIWDARTGKELVVFRGQHSWIHSGCFSPDGARMITTSDDGTARVWDTSTGKEIAILEKQDTDRPACFDPTGNFIVTTSRKGPIRLWDTRTLKVKQTLPIYDGKDVRSFDINPTGTQLVVTSDYQPIQVWNTVTGASIATVKVGSQEITTTVEFSRDGTRVVSASIDGTARVWESSTGKVIAVLTGHLKPLHTAEFSPDGKRVVTSSDDGTARIWDAESGALLSVLAGHEGIVHTASFSPNGDRILTASGDGTARLWNAMNVGNVLVKDTLNWSNPGFSPKGDRIVAASYKGVHVWDAATGVEIALFGQENTWTASFDSNGGRIISAAENKAHVWDTTTWKELLTLEGYKDRVVSAAFSGDGKRIVTGTFDGTAHIWDANTGNELARLNDPNDSDIVDAKFSPDGRHVVVASSYAVRIWDLGTKAKIASYTNYSGRISSLNYSPDGKLLVIAAEITRVVDSTTGQEVASLKGHKAPINSAAYSPDGALIVTASGDGTARIWSGKTYQQVASLDSLSGNPVSGVNFSPDGNVIVTSASSDAIRLWDVSRLRRLSGPMLRDDVCAEKLRGAQEFTVRDAEDPILYGRSGNNPCHRSGLLAFGHWFSD
jgi:WD40 repeat protein